MKKIKHSKIVRSFSIVISAGLLVGFQPVPTDIPHFTQVQAELFAGPEAQAVVWADFDNDGDLDLTVGYRRGGIKFFAQTKGTFQDAKDIIGIPSDMTDYRALSWGDYNADGYPDLYVGFGRDTGLKNRLYRGSQNGFEEVAENVGLDVIGTTRQSIWIDYDQDGDSDLFVTMRDRTSRLYQNNNGKFIDISSSSGLSDPRRGVGAVWFDFDQDSDLDLYAPNQSGDRDGFYQNNNGQFMDIAQTLGMDKARRPLNEGSVGATLCDVNADGHMDIFVPVYGADMLYIADGKGGYREAAKDWGVNATDLAVSADCGDFDNDGRDDLYVVAYKRGETHGYDHLYHNQGDHFIDLFPKEHELFDGDHGVRFSDYDNDGDLDIAISNRSKDGRVSLWKNELINRDTIKSETGAHFLKILLLDADGRYTRQGDEIRVFDHKTSRVIGTKIIDTGGGYISQNMQPVHFGLGEVEKVDVEVTSITQAGRIKQKISNVNSDQTITIRLQSNK
ncbi:CRTAC1 family protein [Kordiimonas sp. SCSIO 12610]|uniref:CRTAC1 family protein n=1 Tax=Kordiimonas sp. SCSIO 12610 TaxID=2829597 RepID=UPI00210B8474|nr:CRTAC1 family protein [Kordiimonas sp. SCSIO 12610]UTW54728.1 CRTAC1 family protein [Kordiimonas sp. SCSIO 12610]